MTLRVAHVSDIHLRNLKYHEEYERVFEDLYSKLVELKPDVIINTGDTAHTKTQISPEFVHMASRHFDRMAEITDYHVILGNHDMNLMNPDRQDAITPIIENIGNKKVFLHKKSGKAFEIVKDGQTYSFWVFSLADQSNYPTKKDWSSSSSDVNIGLFHGSVRNCLTDMNWRMTNAEHDVEIFDGLDFALLGDIHKQQFFRDRTIGYAGSLIQQNFGEDPTKGFLLWDFEKKGQPHKVRPVNLTGSRPFISLKLDDDLKPIASSNVPADAHIRIVPPRPLTVSEQKNVEKDVKKNFNPKDVITLSSNNITEQKVSVGRNLSEVENLRTINVQERLLREFLKGRVVDAEIMTKILDLNRRFQIHIDQTEEPVRNISWKIEKLGWSNLFNFGKSNIIDFSRLGGVTGIFAPNGSGKSNFIDVILETCFDATTKGINKNIFLINDNKDMAISVAEIVANGHTYEIERSIEKIKFGNKSEKVKEWGKTTVEFSQLDEVGDKHSLVGTLRPETESKIRQTVGTFDDFMLTSLFAQWNPLDIIAVKETKRKEIIYRFLDLDIFGIKANLAKDELKSYTKQLSEIADEELSGKLSDLEARLVSATKLLESHRGIEKVQAQEVEYINQRMQVLREKQNSLRKAIGRSADVVEKELDISKALLQKNVDSTENLKAESDKLKTQRHNILASQNGFDEDFAQQKSEERLQCSKRFTDLSIRRGSLSYLVAEAERAKAQLEMVPCGDRYPGCMFIKNAFEQKNKLEDLQKELRDIEEQRANESAIFAALEVYDNSLAAFRKQKGELALLSRDIENYVLRIAAQELKEKEIRDTINRLASELIVSKENSALQTSIEEIQREIDGEMTRRERLNQDLTKLRDVVLFSDSKEIGALTAEIASARKRLTQAIDLKNTCLAYDHYIDAMGKDGLPLQILAQKLPLINDEINKILSSVTDFGVFLEYDHEEQSIKFYIQYGQYKNRLLELGSGAEKFLASIAIRNALLNISILPKSNMMIIDEGFGKLDPKNLEAVQLMFDYLRSTFDHVFVISHLDTMKDIVDNIVEIAADDEGYAHIEIGE